MFRALINSGVHIEYPIQFSAKDCLMITGGTGSLGKALIKRLLAETPIQRMIVLSRDEQKQFDFSMELSPEERERVRFFGRR